MSGSADRCHLNVDGYLLEGWQSASARLAVSYESGGCTLSDQFRPVGEHASEDETTMSTSLWFTRPSLQNNNPLFASSNDIAHSHAFNYRQATMPMSALTARPLPTAVQPLHPARTCYDITQSSRPTYDRFPPNDCKYLELQPFQNRPTCSWFSPAGGSVHQVPLSQCVGLSSCRPNNTYGPRLEIPDAPSAWVHIKPERRPSLSAASCNVDLATKVAQTLPTYSNSQQIKYERSERNENDVSVSTNFDRDDRTAGHCQSDTSPSSAEQFSDVV